MYLPKENRSRHRNFANKPKKKWKMRIVNTVKESKSLKNGNVLGVYKVLIDDKYEEVVVRNGDVINLISHGLENISLVKPRDEFIKEFLRVSEA